MTPIILFGCGKIADVAISMLQCLPQYCLTGFTCEQTYLPGSQHYDLPVYPFEQLPQHCPPQTVKLFIAIGYQDLNQQRQRIFSRVKQLGYTCVNLLHPTAVIAADVQLGENILVCEHASVQAGVRLEDNVMLWPNVTVGHHSHMHAHSWLAAGVTIAGSSDLGQKCFCGVNSTVGHNIQIGAHSILGAGSVVTKSAADNSVFIQADTAQYRLDSQHFLQLSSMID